MSDAICPKRVVKQAISLLTRVEVDNDELEQDIIYNIADLEELALRFDRGGITLIRDDGSTNTHFNKE